MKRLIWSRSARADLARIARYFVGKDPRVAESLTQRIRAAAEKLLRRDIGRRLGRMPGVQEKRVLRTRYILAYAWSEKKDALIILRVIHTSQNWTAASWPDSD